MADLARKSPPILKEHLRIRQTLDKPHSPWIGMRLFKGPIYSPICALYRTLYIGLFILGLYTIGPYKVGPYIQDAICVKGPIFINWALCKKVLYKKRPICRPIYIYIHAL